MARTATAAATTTAMTTSPSTTDEEIDSAAAATCTQIQAEARKITIRLDDVNENLICRLCKGYFRDAHKIKECAHTFCSSCIRHYFTKDKKNNACPTCKVYLSPKPWEFLVADPTYQGIVDKLLPEFAPRDEVERRAFYKQHGFPLKPRPTSNATSTPSPFQQANGDSGSSALTQSTTTSADSSTSPNKPVEKIAFELRPQTGPGIPLFLHLKRLKQPRMHTDANFRIQFLRKYVSLKLKLASPSHVEILCRGVTLGSEYSLAFVRRTIWDDAKSKMILEYRGAVV